jgi:molybdopterin-guanine dinucleotide biosynthesis protein B
LIVAVMPLLRASGLLVSTIRRADHGFDMDQTGKDTYRHRQAGAHQVLVISSRRWALLHKEQRPARSLLEVLGYLEPVDLVLIEGCESYPYPKLEVFRPTLGKPCLWTSEPEVVAVASDSTADIGSRILLPLNQPKTVASWIRTRVVTDGWPGS